MNNIMQSITFEYTSTEICGEMSNSRDWHCLMTSKKIYPENTVVHDTTELGRNTIITDHLW